MALQESGVVLVAKNYSDYMNKMRAINKAHRDAFSSGTASRAKGIGSGARSASGGVSTLAGAFRGLQVAVGAFMAIAIVRKITNLAQASMQLALTEETLRVSLTEVAKATGYNAEQIDYAIESLRQQGIATVSAEKALMRMARANISWSEASKLAAIAQGSAITAGMTSSAAFERLITGIQKMEPELLDELGINLRRGESYRKLAAELGKSEKNLTQAERQQAILNSVYEQSAVVLGVYDAAMDTASKKQGSMTRYIEETQLNLGRMLAPLGRASTDLQYNFWKGASEASKGLASFNVVLDIALDGLSQAAIDVVNAGKKAEESKGFWEELGTFIHKFAQASVISLVSWASHVVATMDRVGNKLTQINESIAGTLAAAAEGDPARALENLSKMLQPATETDYGEDVLKTFEATMKRVKKDFPDLFKDFEELGKVVETSLDPNTGEEVVENMEELTEATKAQIDVLRQLEKIQDQYNAGLESAFKQYDRGMNQALADAVKKQQDLSKNLADDLTNVDTEMADDIARVREEGNQRILDDQKQHHRDMLREKERFELSMRQASRRFLVQDRRLRAEGDVLALMNLREDFQLQQQEAQENFDVQRRYQDSDTQEQIQQQKQEIDNRVAEIQKESEKRKEELRARFAEEMQQVKETLDERQETLRDAYREELSMLELARLEQFEELGASMKDQAKLTDEGMQEIADAMRRVFGQDEEADQLIKGWSSRTETLFGETIAEMQARLEEFGGQVAQLSSNTSRSSAPSNVQPGLRPTPQRIPMRFGGEGVVTGPATFEVEPGVREHVSFTPMSAMAGNIQLGGRAGIDVSGLSEGVGAATEERIADTLVRELEIAIQRMSRRS